MPVCHEEAESVVFVDDNTDRVTANNPEELVDNFRDKSITLWFHCSNWVQTVILEEEIISTIW